tara:strand:- start:27 stop:239 length:213 start_codon:yes stop_codon:yes gene_type:complete
MIEATIGIILATTASVTLLITLGISNKSIKNAGREALSAPEKQIIRNAGYSQEEMINIEIDIKNIDLTNY